MRKCFVTMFLSMLFFMSKAQVMQAGTVSATLSIPQLKCWECKDRLDKFLETEKGSNGDAGIVKWTIYLNTATLKIQFIPDRITLAYIKTEIANDGFDVDTLKADPLAYKNIPPICKRKEDGGGQKKGAPPCSLPPDERAFTDLKKE